MTVGIATLTSSTSLAHSLRTAAGHEAEAHTRSSVRSARSLCWLLRLLADSLAAKHSAVEGPAARATPEASTRAAAIDRIERKRTRRLIDVTCSRSTRA